MLHIFAIILLCAGVKGNLSHKNTLGRFDNESPETKSHGKEDMSMFQFAALATSVILVIQELKMFYKILIAYSNYHLSTLKLMNYQITESSNRLIKKVRDKNMNQIAKNAFLS